MRSVAKGSISGFTRSKYRVLASIQFDSWAVLILPPEGFLSGKGASIQKSVIEADDSTESSNGSNVHS